MELRQLEYFIAVSEELHFGKAALRMHIAEQALGYQIKKLEEELGFALFERTTRRVRLTTAGSYFLDEAQSILKQANRASDTALRISKGEAGVCKLGYESSTVTSILPDFVKLFRAEYPEFGLELTEYSKAGLTPLREGETDGCLITRYMKIPRGFEYIPIMKDIAVVALPIEHPKAKPDGISITELSDIPFLGYGDPNGASANSFMTSLMEGAGSQALPKHDADTYMALLSLVSAGLGFTIVTSSMSHLFAEKICYAPLLDMEVPVDYGIAFRDEDESATSMTGPMRAVAKHLVELI